MDEEAGEELARAAGTGEVGQLSGELPMLGGTSRLPTTEREQGLWLREQFESGALPRDPELLRTLLAQARRDPAMVERLVTQAKDAKGKDIYTRRVNDPTERILGLDGLDTSQFNM